MAKAGLNKPAFNPRLLGSDQKQLFCGSINTQSHGWVFFG